MIVYFGLFNDALGDSSDRNVTTERRNGFQFSTDAKIHLRRPLRLVSRWWGRRCVKVNAAIYHSPPSKAIREWRLGESQLYLGAGIAQSV
jgi:hypothetical protein